MTTYDEHQLRAMASDMRKKIAGIGVPDRLGKRLTRLIDKIDGAADGKVTEHDLQAAVDQINLDLACDADRQVRMEGMALLVDQAIEEDDPGAWRDAMLRWLPLLPEDYLRGLMMVFSGGIEDVEFLQAMELAEMDAATEIRQ